MDLSCKCQAIPFENEELFVRIDDELKSVEKINLDFGKVAVFGHYVRTISIENLEETEILSYRIKRDAEVDEIYQVFKFNKVEGFLLKGKQLKLKISYYPKIPFQIDIDHFEFVDSCFNIIQITVRGESIGPQLSTSVKSLAFTLRSPKKLCKNILEIKNATEIPAEFKFDVNENEELFRVEPKQGTIERSIYINISFTPKELGVYSQQLACLVFGHDPLIIDLFGVNSEETSDVTFKPYLFPFEETIGYGAYLRDTVNVRKTVPPVSLTKCNIDFERLFLEKNKANIATQATSLTNHMKKDIEVNWIEDDQVFRVFPKRVRIPPKDSALFEFCFVPTDNYGIYSKTLLAQIYWSPEFKSLQPAEESSSIPLSLGVNLQGITYPDDHYLISQTKIIPSEIVFPPCLPGEVTHTNFKILNTGPLTLTFKLSPPSNSNIIMKPMMGLIKQSVIIVAQLRTPRKLPRKCSEGWHVMLNNQESKKIPFTLSGISTLPSVELGKNNCIKFDTVQPGTHTIQTFPLRNTSHFHISFSIMSPDDVDLKFQPTEGDIAPHDTIFVTFHHTASLCSPKKIVLICKIQAMQKMLQSIGEVYEEEFIIHADAAYSQLCATPNNHDFELVQWGKTIGSEFSIFNFGITTIHFHMDTCKRSHNKDIFKVSPESGSLDPGERMTIRFEGCTRTLGENDISIVYVNRISKNSQETTGKESKELFRFSYCCAFPKLQIVEIVEDDFGPLFGKKHLWTFFNIKRLNYLLQNIKSQKTETVEMYLPDFEIGSGPFCITFLMENKTLFDAEIKLKRKKVCDCQMKSVQSTFNSSKKIFDCPHREMLSIEMNDTTFQKNSRRLLTIHVKYTIPGDTKIAYILDIGDDRLIELLFQIHTIPADTAEISSFTKKFVATMENVSMDRRVPPIQTFWLYNNTKMSVKYKMDTSEVTRICQRERFNIGECVNPEGQIGPYRSWPLQFKFHPIEVKVHEVFIPIKFGDITKMLQVTGNGVPVMKPLDLERVTDMPTIGMTTNKFPATLSKNYLIFNSLLVWNTSEQIIFINNVTKDRIIQYEWAEVGIRNILNITASPKSGVLQPKESQTIVIKVKSFNEPCITDKLLNCTLTDYNQMYLHRTSVALQDEKFKELEGQFVLNEKGEKEYMKNDIILYDIPKPDTISISISVNILHDQDIRLSQEGSNNLIEWFTWSPQEDMDINVQNLLKTFSYSMENRTRNPETEIGKNIEVYKHVDIFRVVLEELITNVTFSKTFKELLRCSLEKVPPYYHQITMDDRLNQKTMVDPVNKDTLDKIRQQEIKKFFEKPTLSVISEVLKELILDGIQETFKLGITHPTDTDYKQMDKGVEELLKICKDCSCKINKM
ncbi:unnamed protein product [Phaedon cochleariae]|uniref:Uncharacterized protein n=1 Tax=Phaedon cochleariae TaxID=80249 RepID=A0A9N9SE47_PHACE|nr:unnamed protein product [Phaedon cochleariae]